MTREKATRIVNDFFNDMNPTLWNGEGNKPESFDERPSLLRFSLYQR